MELSHQFLLSMPTLEDPNFQRTLSFICEHSEHGAMGLVVNRPMALTVGEVLQHLGIEPSAPQVARTPVHFGGPVETERGFILHDREQQWEGTMPLSETVALTTSRDILEAMARGEGPRNALVTLGYSGWGAGQLEDEIAQNAWLTCPASDEILFHIPAEERLAAAAAQLGIDLDLMSSDAGHA